MSTEPLITYITTCKGRLAHLKQTLPIVARQPGISCVVVDYNCPQNTYHWLGENYPQVKVVRVENQPGFHLSRARNLGARNATTPWLAFFDADVILEPDFFEKVAALLKPGRFYRPDPPTKQTWGSFICPRADFERIEGYDETYQGWGGEDDDIYDLLQMRGTKYDHFPAEWVTEIEHGDDLRTQFHAERAKHITHRINQLYKHIKLDCVRLSNGLLTAEKRKAIYTEVTQKIQSLKPGDQDKEIAINILLPQIFVSPPPRDEPYTTLESAVIKRRVTYALRLSPVPQWARQPAPQKVNV